MYSGRVCLLLLVLALIASPAFAAVYVVTNGADSGVGTLRDAITLANGTAGADTIGFQIPPIGAPATIQPTNYLPLITDPVTIDGWSQLGGSICQAGIEIDGSLAGSANGLSLWVTTNCVIRGICINRFNGNGILINQGGNHRIYGCFIGTDITGMTDLGNTNDGIVIISSVLNSIGLIPTYSCTNRNIISGNGKNGVRLTSLTGVSCTGNILQNNHIGADANGTGALPNDQDGVRLENSEVYGNDVGSTASPKPVNVISGNRTNGVYVYLGGSNRVLGNDLGVDRSGLAALANGLNGVWITNAAGCSVGDSSGEARNIISGNGDDGVEISGASSAGNVVQGNYIGISSNGFFAIPNGGHGVLLTAACTQNKVGDESSVLGRNVISGNDECGVKIGESAFGNWIHRNYIGVAANGLIAVSNRLHGVLVENAAHGNFVGSGGYTDSGNVISGNGYTNTCHGVCIQNGAWGIEVDRNIIGLSVANLPVPNAGDGVHIENAHTNTIGTPSALAGNVISGNSRDGVRIGPTSAGNSVYQNRIGLDTNGTSARANSGEGIHIYRASRNLIGTNGPHNVISGNAGSGVLIEDNTLAHDNVLQNNYIGTDITGGFGIGNSDHGVRIVGGVSNLVGSVSLGNVISANDRTGVRLDSSASYNQILRNVIGLDAAGSTALGNQMNGVYISGSPRNTIGAAGGLGNVISANTDDGIHILGANSVSNTIKANTIGMDTARLYARGNTGHGVWIGTSAAGTRIGSSDITELNLIAYNGDCGVRITSGTNNAILGNSIYSNANLGIDLGTSAGVTPNDVQDPDTGANYLQNYPVLYEATTGSVIIAGLMNSRPSTTYWLDFFLCDAPDPSGYGEGFLPIAGTNLTTDADGNATFEFTLPGTIATAKYLTATATDPFGNTSEFAKDVLIVGNEAYGDIDHDGMPTRWEGPNHLDPNDATGTNGAAGDPDNDGVANYDEYVADTAPDSASSFFRLLSINQPSTMLVSYTSTNTRYYVVASTTNVLDGTVWSNVYPYSVTGSNGVSTASDAVATTRLYRVTVQLTP